MSLAVEKNDFVVVILFSEQRPRFVNYSYSKYEKRRGWGD
jgi:hypothetical protein